MSSLHWVSDLSGHISRLFKVDGVEVGNVKANRVIKRLGNAPEETAEQEECSWLRQGREFQFETSREGNLPFSPNSGICCCRKK